MEYREWWREFDDIDLRDGNVNFIMNDEQDMIEISYSDGMFIDVGLDKDNIYNITVVASNDVEGWKEPLCVKQFADRDKLHDCLQEMIDRFREDIPDEDENERRTAELLDKYGIDFINVPKDEIAELLNEELKAPKKGSSEYLRLLCAYLYCAGGDDAVKLIKKAKYSVNMDVGAMIDGEWISSLENGGMPDGYVRSREEIVASIILYYMDYEYKQQWK